MTTFSFPAAEKELGALSGLTASLGINKCLIQMCPEADLEGEDIPSPAEPSGRGSGVGREQQGQGQGQGSGSNWAVARARRSAETKESSN